MYDFVFSHDCHISEPSDLLEKNLPAKFKSVMLSAERSGNNMVFRSGDTTLYHMSVMGKGDISRSYSGEELRPGARTGGYDIGFRLEEMARSGVDSTIVFSGLTGFAYALDPDPGLAHMQVFNDWCVDHLRELPHTFVPTAMLPAHSPEAAEVEMERVLKLGYRSVMLPIDTYPGAPRYIDPAWDRLWSLCTEAGVPMTMHSGTSCAPIRYQGPGAACMNYYQLGLIAQESIAAMVASGLFDRHPKLRLVNCESGADWLLWMGERLDEAYTRHNFYVDPKLSRLPSEILYSHVLATTHREKGCLNNLRYTGHDCVIWADDYPHAEGTFPETKSVLEGLFDGIDVAPDVQNLVVGGTCAKLYGVDPKEAKLEKQRFSNRAVA